MSFVIKRWGDAHANLPTGQGGLAKADVAPRSNEAASVGPPTVEGFLISGTDIYAFGGSQIGRPQPSKPISRPSTASGVDVFDDGL